MKKHENSLSDWLDNQDVILALHISPRTLQTLRSNGTLPFSRIGNKIYYFKQDIIKILSDNYTLNKIKPTCTFAGRQPANSTAHK